MLFILFSCKDSESQWGDITKYIQERHQIEIVQDFSYEHLTDQEWIDFFCVMYLTSNNEGDMHSSNGVREKAIRLLKFKKILRVIRIKHWSSGAIKTKKIIRFDLQQYYNNPHDVIHSTDNNLWILEATEIWLTEYERYQKNMFFGDENKTSSLWDDLCRKSNYQTHGQIDIIKNAIAKYERYTRTTMKLNIELIKDQLSSLTAPSISAQS